MVAKILALKRRILKVAFEDVTVPNLRTLASAASNVGLTAADTLQYIFPEEGNDKVKDILREYDGVRSNLKKRYSEAKLNYPKRFAIEEESSAIIYAITRILSPEVVLETGVADGHSSYLILNAIEKNSKGKLFSFDTGNDVGSLVDEPLKANWKLEVLRPPLHSSFLKLVEELPRLDLFLHDSDHRYDWQKFEYEHILPKMRPRSILASDDVDASLAFLNFSRKIDRKPVLMIEKRKVFGIINLN